MTPDRPGATRRTISHCGTFALASFSAKDARERHGAKDVRIDNRPDLDPTRPYLVTAAKPGRNGSGAP